MEQPAGEKTLEEMPKSCSSVSSSVSPQKEGIVETHQIEDLFSSPTPVKLKEPSRIKSKEELAAEELAELPKMCWTLLDLFDRMATSLRLLCLRRRTKTFKNISTQVEILTGRKFLFMHLAKIKYMLPEAVQIEKTLIHDGKTKSMKPDLEISLLFDVVKDHHEESTFVALRTLFCSRLRDFYIKNPQACDVPEAELPEPFNKRSITCKADSISKDLSASTETEILSAVHLPYFRRRFSQISTAVEMKNTSHSPVKSACEANGELNGDIAKPQPLSTSDCVASMSESTPTKLLVESDSVLIETPVQSTPMRPISPTRSVLTCEDESKMTNPQNCKQSSSTAKKSLDFYSMDGKDTIFSHNNVSICSSDFVILIHQIFRSINFCPITKEELVQKIIMNNLEIEDRSEVETQMELLEKVVPDWFCKKLAPSGDLLYNVKKLSDLSSVCERINVK